MTEHENQTPPTLGTPELDATVSHSDLPPSGPAPRLGPESIGGYRVIGLLGEGGMGVVWEAEQASPRRRVAVKVMRQGHLVDDLHARMFHREAESLGRLRHPNIATIYEAGHTADGHDYFAMELVRGQRLDRWLAGRGGALTPKEVTQRLDVFRTIAEAVHYAHQRGVIHRDLKPPNIVMATPEEGGGAPATPVVKILDFGLARLISEETDDGTLTQEGMIRGTVAYMSPEQARGDVAAIDVRSDVYSLGVILYEMLAGRRPHEMSGLSLIDAARVVATEPAPRLASAWRGTRALDRDLETIVAKALELEPDRRYAGAGDLAADVARYLGSLPIVARPATRAYRARMFVRRHRAGVVAAASVVVALLAGIAGTTAGLVSALRSSRLAAARAAELEKVSSFQSNMLGQIDPTTAGARLSAEVSTRFAAALVKAGVPDAERDERVGAFRRQWSTVNATDTALSLIDATILKPAVKAIGEQFKDQPLIAAKLRQVLAQRYLDLGLYEEAAPLQQSALEARRRVLGNDQPDTLESIDAAAVLLGQEGKYEEAKPLFAEAIAGRRRVLGNDDPETLTSIFEMGTLLYYQGKYSEAEPYYREAMDGRRRTLGADHPDTLQSIRAQGWLRLAQGKLGEAEALQREAVERCCRTAGEASPDCVKSLTGLATTLKWQGKYGDAEPLDRRVLDSDRRRLGEDHPDTLLAMSALGETLRNLKRLSDAENLLRDATDRQRRLLGDEHPDTLVSIGRLGKVLYDLGEYREAEPYYREVLEGRRRTLGTDHPDTLTALSNLGFLLQRMGRLDEAEARFREVLEARRRTSGPDHPATVTTLFNLGRLQLAQGNLDEAEATFRDVLERRRRVLGNDHPEVQNTLQALGVLLERRGRYAEAERALRECHELRARALPAGDPRTSEALSLLGDAVARQGRFAEAETMLLAAHAGLVQPASADLDRETMRRIVQLYDAWDTAEPGKGHAAKATVWQSKLDASNARVSGKPATEPRTPGRPAGVRARVAIGSS